MRRMWDSPALRGLLIAAAVLIVVVGVFVGVVAYVFGTNEDGGSVRMTPEQISRFETSMARLPSLEEARAELDRRVVGVAEIATRLSPSLVFAWDTADNPNTESPCDADTRGRVGKSRYRTADGGIDDSVWPSFVEAVRNYLGIDDGGDQQVMRDKPGSHDVDFRAADGFRIQVGSAGRTVVNGSTRCLLPQTDKDAVLAGR